MVRTPRHDRNCWLQPPRSAAYTLVELLIVIAIMGIFVGLALTRFEPGLHDQLRSAAQVVSADLALARSLAVSNNSQYEITFDLARHRYWLEHRGSNATLDILPPSPYRDPADPSTRQTTHLGKLPSLSSHLELAAVRKVSSTKEVDATSVAFGPLGALTQAEDCWIWLAIGRGIGRRYVPVEVDSITGLTRVGDLHATGPPSLQGSSSPAPPVP